ncbi:hypothetical protein ACFSBZ_11505 [Amnibacterium flavum]|uniref:Uncharacterized protein n=1 Tax=Amnibacterium flavum TaxID=2173173 RepID=A0A2V1HWA1_9MICO|nr:hypothetical protein [Amnibacterium flavum]PVZ95439.1 hypothetical protein DDQ50_02720 [Amnibacterium flavum]
MTDTMEPPTEAVALNAVVTPTDDPNELLVQATLPAGETTIGLIRIEEVGAFAYPQAPSFPRIGPFDAIEDAVAACRDAIASLFHGPSATA